MKTQNVELRLQSLARIAKPVLSRRMQSNCCVAATKAGLKVLQRWDIDAHAVICRAGVFNKAWHETPTAQWLFAGQRTVGQAYSLVVDVNDDGEGIPGHVVIHAKHRGKHWLLDLSAWQFDRPKHKISVESGLLVPCPPMTGQWRVSAHGSHGELILYEPHPWPNRTHWREAPDWFLPTEMHRRMHAANVKELAEDALRMA